ncbi:hypothetical protein [Snuella lapsa]|uniref:Uncharacterized protein n=1 Tax=Snuella lapsa TaxID=870481 RepID=A0ABP6X7X1_9FLAO
MKKTNKVIDLFGKERIVQNEGVKYSELLNDFIKPFEHDFDENYDIDDVLEFAIQVWNFGNLKSVVPPEEFDEILSPSKNLNTKEKVIFEKMLEAKVNAFGQYERFIIDFTLKEVSNELRLEVVAGDFEAFHESLEDRFSYEPIEEDFEQNYVNRYAVILKPLEPFFEWINTIYTEETITRVEEANVYLVDDGIQDLEKWLKKKYDKFFVMELEDWHVNKKEWPQKRSYKMFKKWFQVSISKMVYDMEPRPVTKEV